MTTPEIIAAALKEDLGNGDHTSLSCIPSDAQGAAKLLVKEAGVLAGIEEAEEVFRQLDPSIEFKALMKDGQDISVGDIAFTVHGASRSLLSAERLALNIMQRMSGIATTTKMYVDACKGTSAQVLDTRKTTPLLRGLEKKAVLLGGGKNHRFGLYDMIMIKDNHIDFAGGIQQALKKTWEYLQELENPLRVEIEARDLDEVRTILSVGLCDRIMLDNFNYADTRAAVNMIDGALETESSGGITLDTIAQYAACGVDFISVGALTHQLKSLDLSLKAL